MKLLFCALALCTLLAPAIADDAATSPLAVAKPNVKSVETDFSWQITPVVLPEDNAAAMLNMKFWRFKVESPDKNLRCAYKLELRRYQQTPVAISDGNFNVSSGKAEFTLGLMPVGENAVWEAKEIKVSTRFRSLDSAPSINNYDYPKVCKNPIKDIISRGTIVVSAATAEVNADGSAVLTRFRVNITPDNGENQLVLVFQPQE